MMTYEEFKGKMINSIKEYLPAKYSEFDIFVVSIQKINQKLDGLRIKIPGAKTCPTIYINDFYDAYAKKNDFEWIMRGAANIITRIESSMPQKETEVQDFMYNASLNAELFRRNVVFELVNTEMNEELLKRVPYRKFNDLSVVYRWIYDVGSNGQSGILITNELAKQYSMSETDLYENALKNTKRLFPIKIESMREFAERILGAVYPSGMVSLTQEDMGPIDSMWILSNIIHTNGSTVLLYPEILDEVVKLADSELLLLPASRHEIIAVSVKTLKMIGQKTEEVEKMVHEINLEHVPLGEQLSNEVYLYGDTREVTLANPFR